jgi:hypothetical protein
MSHYVQARFHAAGPPLHHPTFDTEQIVPLLLVNFDRFMNACS